MGFFQLNRRSPFCTSYVSLGITYTSNFCFSFCNWFSFKNLFICPIGIPRIWYSCYILPLLTFPDLLIQGLSCWWNDFCFRCKLLIMKPTLPHSSISSSSSSSVLQDKIIYCQQSADLWAIFHFYSKTSQFDIMRSVLEIELRDKIKKVDVVEE